jgi:hypothetical protein
MKELWCVIESSSEGEIFKPDFFDSREDAAAFIAKDASECFANINDLPEANMEVGFDNDEPLGQVRTDKYSWVWHGFEVTEEIENILKENNNV